MRIHSPAFEMGGRIPSKYTCQGTNISPPLVIDEVPTPAKSIVLIFDDFDAALEPNGWGKTYDHWLVANIPAHSAVFKEGSPPADAIELTNHYGRQSYGGPCPPTFDHLYTFRAYALDAILDLKPTDDKTILLEKMQGHVVDSAMLVARYAKK